MIFLFKFPVLNSFLLNYFYIRSVILCALSLLPPLKLFLLVTWYCFVRLLHFSKPKTYNMAQLVHVVPIIIISFYYHCFYCSIIGCFSVCAVIMPPCWQYNNINLCCSTQCSALQVSYFIFFQLLLGNCLKTRRRGREGEWKRKVEKSAWRRWKRVMHRDWLGHEHIQIAFGQLIKSL